MSKLRRYNPNGHPVFITDVTHERRRFLQENADIFWNSVNNILNKHSFELIAWVLIPDHFHLLIDVRNENMSDIMHDLKLSFSAYYRKRFNLKSGRVWQLRFWDHIIRDEEDFNHHFDYIHYNPVKHGLVNSPFDYAESSIHLYGEFYQDDWGIKEAPEFKGEYGE